MKIEELEFENEYLKERNKELHRRLQKKESPLQSELNSLRLRLKWKEKDCIFTFNRMLNAHNEMKEIFKMIAPLYDIPCESFHSVMDGKDESVWANVIIKKHGPVKDYKVIDIVEKLVEDMKKVKIKNYRSKKGKISNFIKKLRGRK